SSNASLTWLCRAASRPAKLRDRALALAFASVLAAVAGVGACSSSGPKGDNFTGTWTFDSGSVDGMCLGQTIMNDLTGRSFTLTKSAMGTAIANCPVTLTGAATKTTTATDGSAGG